MKKIFIMALAGLLMQSCGFEIVDTGHRGVETKFGKVQGITLDEGLHFYNPFTSDIVELDVREQKWSAQTAAYTKDVQQANVDFTLNYYLKKDFVHIMYQNVGKDWANTLLEQIVTGNMKAVIGQFDAVDLIARRLEATAQVESLVREKAVGKGIVITRFEMTNLEYANKFEQAVEAKVVAIQKAEEAKNKTVRIKEEAAQKVIAAKAEAESMRIRANALTQNKALVDYEAVQKWDGKMPQYMMGDSMPFIQIK